MGSRTTTRSALARLADQGLVTLEQNKGAIVTPLDAAEWVQLSAVQIALARLVLADSFLALAPRDFATLGDIAKQIAATDDPLELASLIECYWSIIFTKAERPHIYALMEQTLRKLSRYSALAVKKLPAKARSGWFVILTESLKTGAIDGSIDSFAGAWAQLTSRITAAISAN